MSRCSGCRRVLVPPQRSQHGGLLLVPAAGLQVLVLQGGGSTRQVVAAVGAVLAGSAGLVHKGVNKQQ